MLVDRLGRPLRPGKLAKDEMERYDISVDEKTGEITRITSYDAAVVMEQAHYERTLGNNGFSKKRSHRVIGEMPISEFMELERQAREAGDIVTGKDLKKWLQRNREYMTVPRLNTGRKGRIIIK